MWAAAEGHVDVVETLIDMGANFTTPLDSGFTPDDGRRRRSWPSSP